MDIRYKLGAKDEDVKKADAFLTELSRLSCKHGVAIGDGSVLFMMEREDYELGYSIDDESYLSFG